MKPRTRRKRARRSLPAVRAEARIPVGTLCKIIDTESPNAGELVTVVGYTEEAEVYDLQGKSVGCQCCYDVEPDEDWVNPSGHPWAMPEGSLKPLPPL
jgi:hypothetical protein